jgi:hypothetical protein
MALINPPSLYTGGAVRLDSTPSVNFYAELMARQQAKRDSLDQYYANELNRVTNSGARTKDITSPGGIGDQVNNLRSYWLQNKQFLDNPSRDRFQSRAEFDHQLQTIFNNIQKSKESQEAEQHIATLSGKQGYVFTDKDHDIAHRFSLPINDPNRLDQDGNEPSIADLSSNVPEFTPDKRKNAYMGASQGMKPSTTAGKPYDQLNGYQNVDYTTGFNGNQIQQIGHSYGMQAQPNTSMGNYYERLMHTMTPEIHDQYNKDYKRLFPDGGDMVTPQQLAMVDGALQAEQEKHIDKKRERDLTWAEKQKQSNIVLNRSLSPSGTPQQENQSADAIIQGNINNADEKTGEFNSDARLYKAITGETQGKNSVIRVDKDGNYSYGKREVDDNGNPTGNIVGIKQIPAPQAKAAIIKEYKTGLQGTYNTGKPNVHERTYNYKGKTYSQSQIEQAAKNSGRTVQEYLNELGIK